jgi:methylmalonyl-CoA mutase
LVDIVQQLDDLESPEVGLLFKNALHKKNMGRNFYLELAAIRAMRRLSNQLQQDYKVPDPTPIKIYAHVGPELALNNLQESMIAYTTAAWAAVTGGADFIHIEPQAAASDPLSQQLARNVFHLFDMESHLLHVIDPAAGSYAIESLTTRLAERAWEQFKTSIDDD